MKTYDLLRIGFQRRKRTLKCIILGGVVLSLAGYALAFTSFWQSQHTEDQKGNGDRHVLLKNKGEDTGILFGQHENTTHGSKNMAPKVSGDDTSSSREQDIKTFQAEHDDLSKQDDRNIQDSGNIKDGKDIKDGQDIKDVQDIKDGYDIKNGQDIKDGQNKQDERNPEVAETASQEGESIKPRLSTNETMATGLLKAELEAKTVQVRLLSEPIVYNYNFEDLRNPVDACTVSKPRVLFVVPSAPENFQRRMNVRNGNVGEYVRQTSNSAKLVFFMGRPPCGEDALKTQANITDEFREHRDIVQENFEDVFKNTRLKAVSMLKWTVTYCKEAKYVIRIEDDVSVNIPKIVSVLEAKSREHYDFIIGDVKFGWKPVRKEDKEYLKYYVSEEEYPGPTYPPFAVGGLLGYPLSTVSLLYQAALRLKPLWLDDVFITGICASRLQVPLLKDPDFVFHR